MPTGEPLPTLSNCIDSHFAPAGRQCEAAVQSLAARLAGDNLVQTLLDGFPEIVVILNRQRQIVACNATLPTVVGRTREELLGQRVGEAFGCPRADETPGGCGTAEACRFCGAVQAMVTCIDTRCATRRECSLTSSSLHTTFELAVLATALNYQEEELNIFAIRDISGERRRDLLERVFFHDALNLLGGIQGISELVARGEDVDFRELSGRLHILAGELVEQIRAQRDLLAAERGELTPERLTVSAIRALEEVRATYELHPAAFGRRIDVLVPLSGDVEVETDPTLLARVLGNLTKNALEASTVGQTVTLTCELTSSGHGVFIVHNSAAMSREVQVQLFKRSFSTKGGAGRGLGTFSVKLLTERYLGGQVMFRSTPEDGTTFQIRLPGARAAASTSAATQNLEADSLAGRLVLLADDALDIRRLVSHYLGRAGANVTQAENGATALRAYERATESGERFDVVVLDHDMPMLDGLRVAQRLRVLGYGGPILLLTADDSNATRSAAVASGCTGVLGKPIGHATLLARIESLLQSGAACVSPNPD